MPKKMLILNIFVLLVPLLAPLISASISFSLSNDFVVPGLSKTIEQVQFNYRHGINQPEVLASDGENIVLYSPVSDLTLFSASLEKNYLSYQILLADINRDSIPDILVGYYFDHQSYQKDTVCKLIFYDGARHYQKTDSAFFENVNSSSLFLNSPFQFVSLKALDIDNDGYNELFFSFDQQHLWDLFGISSLATMGNTILYYSFPDSTLWQKNILSDKTDYLTNINDTNYFITTCYDNFTSKSPVNNTLRSKSTVEVIILKNNGDTLTMIKPVDSLLCTGDSTVFVSEYQYLCSGKIDTTDSQLDILVKHHWQWQCSSFSDTTAFDSSESKLQLYRFTSLNTIEPLWNIDIDSSFTDFFYDPDFPGSFFSINHNNTIYQFDGSMGIIAAVSEPFVADKISWLPSPDNNSGKVVTFKGQTISLYTIAQPTAVDDNNTNPNLPGSFSLGQPYPNPFNSSTVISYSLGQKGKVNIAIYNLLGQKITTLINEHKTAGSYRITWDGNNRLGQTVSSGIYLINATFDNKVKTAKAILLK